MLTMDHTVLIGAPGTGKSAIAKQFVSKHAGFEYISSGQIARQMAEDEARALHALQRGDYAPEAAMRAEIVSRIEKAVFNGKNVLLDGFPRTLAQLVILEETLKATPIYVNINAPWYVCLRRIIMRARPDEQPDAIALRFEIHERDTKPLIQKLLECNTVVGDARAYQINNVATIDMAVARLEAITGYGTERS